MFFDHGVHYMRKKIENLLFNAAYKKEKLRL